jgi:valyl-tRNA synthetase
MIILTKKQIKENNKLKAKSKETLKEKWKNSRKEKTKVTKKHFNTTELSDFYSPSNIETKIYDEWISNNYFSPNYNEKTKGTFIIILPPPNITGVLHLGHALTCSIEDFIVRYNRMHNIKTLYIPGTDAGGIGTQTVVENILYNTEKLTKHDLGKEEFIKKIWKWKEQYQ